MLPGDIILFYSTLLGSNRLDDADTLPPPQFDHTDYSLALQIPFGQPYTVGSQIKVFHAFSGRWGRSSDGRASRSQCEGQEFDPPRLHQFSQKLTSLQVLQTAPNFIISI